jgi:hypothetical protein
MVQGPRFALAAFLVAAVSTAPAATGAPQSGDAYLRSTIGFSAGDVSRVRAGEPVATSPEGREGREIVTFGAVRVDRAPDEVLAYLGRVDALRQGAAVQQLGILSSPPEPGDLAGFTLHPRSVASLKDCRIGECAVQLPGWALARFAKTTDSVHDTARSVALEIANAYIKGGHSALSAYEDRRPAVRPSDEYTRLLGSDQYLPAPLTALRHSLNGYPYRQARGVRDQFFWTVVDFGMKPTFRLNHMAIASGAALDDPAGNLTGVVATIQLLATHYFSSTIEWHFVLRDPQDPSRAYLYYLARSWAPGMTGIRGRVARYTVRSRAEEGIAAYLGATKQRIEAISGAGR